MPDRDIVFTIDNGEIGFINADGSGFVTRKVSRTFVRFFGIGELPAIGGPVTWNLDKRSIVGRYPITTAQTGPPLFIQKDGMISGCSAHSEQLYGQERVKFVSATELLTVVLDINRENKAVLVDSVTCKINSTLYQSPDEYWESLTEADLSSQGWLAISRWMRKEGRNEIAIFSPNSSKPIIIEYADRPAWSPDGELLAYSVHKDGLYIVSKDGTNPRKVVDLGGDRYLFSSHSWSPDGEWLVYARRVPLRNGYTEAIFKLNLLSGAEYEIYVGGFWPDWR